MAEASKTESNPIGFSLPTISFICGNPIITVVKLDGTNHASWSDAVEIWFKGQSVKDHLEKKSLDILALDWPN